MRFKLILALVNDDYQDEVIVAALALDDPASLLRDGDHGLDGIIEVPLPLRARVDELPTPAEVN